MGARESIEQNVPFLCSNQTIIYSGHSQLYLNAFQMCGLSSQNSPATWPLQEVLQVEVYILGGHQDWKKLLWRLTWVESCWGPFVTLRYVMLRIYYLLLKIALFPCTAKMGLELMVSGSLVWCLNCWSFKCYWWCALMGSNTWNRSQTIVKLPHKLPNLLGICQRSSSRLNHNHHCN